MINRKRIDIRMPVEMLKRIDDYQKKNGIATRTATILELLRKGLEK